MVQARRKIQSSTANAGNQRTLRERTASALNFLLQFKHVDPLIECLVELGERRSLHVQYIMYLEIQ